MRHLLDVNVWSPCWTKRTYTMRRLWLCMQRRKLQIATCPLVENAVIRVLNLPGYSRHGPAGFGGGQQQTQQICTLDLDHSSGRTTCPFARTDGLVNWSRILCHNQITDVYLLAWRSPTRAASYAGSPRGLGTVRMAPAAGT